MGSKESSNNKNLNISESIRFIIEELDNLIYEKIALSNEDFIRLNNSVFNKINGRRKKRIKCLYLIEAEDILTNADRNNLKVGYLTCKTMIKNIMESVSFRLGEIRGLENQKINIAKVIEYYILIDTCSEIDMKNIECNFIFDFFEIKEKTIYRFDSANSGTQTYPEEVTLKKAHENIITKLGYQTNGGEAGKDVKSFSDTLFVPLFKYSDIGCNKPAIIIVENAQVNVVSVEGEIQSVSEFITRDDYMEDYLKNKKNVDFCFELYNRVYEDEAYKRLLINSKLVRKVDGAKGKVDFESANACDREIITSNYKMSGRYKRVEFNNLELVVVYLAYVKRISKCLEADKRSSELKSNEIIKFIEEFLDSDKLCEEGRVLLNRVLDGIKEYSEIDLVNLCEEEKNNIVNIEFVIDFINSINIEREFRILKEKKGSIAIFDKNEKSPVNWLKEMIISYLGGIC